MFGPSLHPSHVKDVQRWELMYPALSAHDPDDLVFHNLLPDVLFEVDAQVDNLRLFLRFPEPARKRSLGGVPPSPQRFDEDVELLLAVVAPAVAHGHHVGDCSEALPARVARKARDLRLQVHSYHILLPASG